MITFGDVQVGDTILTLFGERIVATGVEAPALPTPDLRGGRWETLVVRINGRDFLKPGICFRV